MLLLIGHLCLYADFPIGWVLYISLLGLVPSYICTYMCKKQSLHGLRSQDCIQMLVPKVRKAFKYAAPSAWNNVQKELKLSDLITMGEFKSILKDREQESIGRCDCSYIPKLNCFE